MTRLTKASEFWRRSNLYRFRGPQIDVGCPTLALTGTIKASAEAVMAEAIDAVFSICDRPISLERAKSQASVLL
jgi:hypothetical protein